MEFLSQNYADTTTQFSVSSNTSTVGNVITPDPYLQYYTDGYADDSLTASMTISFDATTSVERIALLGVNLKEFSIFYNGATVNSFNFDGVTTSSNFNSNSATSMFFKLATPVDVTSITIDMKKTITPNQEKILGYLYVGASLYELERNPSSSGYKPRVNPKQVVHTLSDGGIRISRIRTKYSTTLKFDYISESERDSLKSVYDRLTPFFFCAFGTATGWDGVFFEANWDGPFDFYEYSDDAASSGFSGSINLKETPF